MVGLKDEIFVKFGQGGLVHQTLKSAFFVFLRIFFPLLAPLWLYSPYFEDPFFTLFSPESEKCHFGMFWQGAGYELNRARRTRGRTGAALGLNMRNAALKLRVGRPTV